LSSDFKDAYFNLVDKDSMNRLQILKVAISSSSYKYTKIQIERNEEVATIWLNSPKDLNALSFQMIADLKAAISELNSDNAIKVIVIRSRMEKIFCAGANIKEFVQKDLSSYPESINFRLAEITFRSSLKPVIAVVQGKALGGGF
jgi:enoyl-CoA hydratase/carnithine racemase